MTSKKIFLNICFAIIAFSIFLLLFLKPKVGPQFERIQPAKSSKSTQSKITTTPTPKVTSNVTSVPKPTSKGK